MGKVYFELELELDKVKDADNTSGQQWSGTWWGPLLPITPRYTLCSDCSVVLPGRSKFPSESLNEPSMLLLFDFYALV
jgi:hypothetical protein